jgi:hypothetical protein
MKRLLFVILLLVALFLPITQVAAMPIGTLLYRTSGDDKMYGYNAQDLIVAEKGKLAHIYSGHTAIYVGQENGIDYIVEMQPKGAIKVPAKYFVNEALGEKLIGAKLPVNATPTQIAKAVLIAKNLASLNLAYDFDFKYQKGVGSGQWTCVGLTEKVYESANISNPTNLQSLEYNPNYYAIDITPDGYDNQNIYNSSGDCFATNLEYSKINPKKNMLIPAPELFGYDVGLEHDGNRYIFLPYTQYLQGSLKDVPVDITVSSSFKEPEVRGDSPILGLVLKWSLINNPISTIKKLASQVGSGLLAIKDKVFPDNNIALADNSNLSDLGFSAASSSKATTSTKATTTKVTKTSAASKTTITKATTSKAVVVKASTTPKIIINKTTATASKTTVASSTPKISKPVIATPPKTFISTTTNTNTNTTITTNLVTNSTTATHVIATPTTRPVVIPLATSSVAITPNPSTSTPVIEPEVVSDARPIALIAKIYSNDGDDWLEIVNTGDQEFDLAANGYRLEKAKTGNDPTLIMRFGNEFDGVYPGGTIIAAYGSYLVASANASLEIKNKADAIAAKDIFSWTEEGYTLYLGTASISSDADADIVDKLGYGEAQYFSGSPAPALKKGYALERKASATSTIELLASGGLQELWPRLFNSDDNGADFLLVPYDLDLIALENNDITTTDSNLFINPHGLDSENLIQLWHFDECYGETTYNELQISGQEPVDLKKPDKWLTGKWGCADSLSSLSERTKGVFSSPFDPNQSTINFYYRNTGGNFSLVLGLTNKNDSGRQATIEFTPYYTSISGFPGPGGRIYSAVLPMDYLWHQVSVVVNRNDGYWSIYLDGQETYSYQYDGIMPTFDSFELGNNQVEAVAIDELTIWDRSLPITEIRSINLLGQPFNPYTWPVAQKVPVLEHYWSFDENTGTTTKDLIGTNDFTVQGDSWDMEGKNSSAIKIGSYLNSKLTDLPVTDLSLSFWWRNTSYANEGRPHITINGKSGNIMTITPTIYNASFVFNNARDTFVPYGGGIFPNDNKWHYLTLTYDSYRYLLSFYIDGEKKMEKPFVKLKSGEEINGIELAQENWPSAIDELKIWSGTLTPAQVLAEYDALK